MLVQLAPSNTTPSKWLQAFNGKYKFVIFRKSGHVLSERALKEVSGRPVCCACSCLALFVSVACPPGPPCSPPERRRAQPCAAGCMEHT